MSMLASLTTRLLRLVGALAALAVLAALLCGVPWGLVTFVGWPLPDHLPSRGEIEATLLNPLSVTLLLDLLACLAWPVWLTFALDVARCIPDAVRGVRPPAIGPVHTLASVLVTTAVLGLSSPPTLIAVAGPVASAQPAAEVAVEQPAHALYATTNQDQHPNATSEPGTVIVQPPHSGVYDSLWRIAERELGDGHRWPELFALNHERPQPDGDALTDPHLVRPGWVLHLPEAVEDHAPPPQAPLTPPNAADSSPSEPAPAPASAAPNRHNAPADALAPSAGTAITLTSGGLVAAALATTVTMGMLIRRRRRMRTYQPGSSDRTPPPAPTPVIHALRLAYDEAHLDTTEPNPIALPTGQTDLPGTTVKESDPDPAVQIGIRDDRARALDLAALHGLGLTGAGAEATVRSLLVHLLATTKATVLTPREDARALLGDEPPVSPRLRLTNSPEEAITVLADYQDPDSTDHHDTDLDIVLVATIDRPHQHLQAVLDTGATYGAAGILLGHWPAGATVRVRSDGLVTAASPTVAGLRGARLFHLDACDTRDLLDLLTDTTSRPPADTVDPTHDAEPLPADDIDAEHDLGVKPPDRDHPHPPEHDLEADQSTEVSSVGKDHHPAVRPTSLPAGQHRDPASASAGWPTATELIAHTTPEPPDRPLSLALFGPLTLTWHTPEATSRDLTSALTPKHKALLAFLALHPNGTSRAAVREALWPEARGRRPYNAFYTALSQIRKALADVTEEQAPDLIVQQNEHVSLDPDLVEVDYWQLIQAEHDRHIASTDKQRMAAWSQIAALYTGDIAQDISAVWLDGPREAAHRTVVDALAGMAAHYRGHNPQRQLQLLERARLLNPENEAIYRDIIRVQAELGLTDAISRTLHLLTTTLADIGERPHPSTLTLARTLQARHTQIAR